MFFFPFSCPSSLELVLGRFCGEVPAVGVAVGLAGLCLEFLRGVRAQWKPLQTFGGFRWARAPRGDSGWRLGVSAVALPVGASLRGYLEAGSRELV